VSRYQKGKINLDLTEARDSEWQWHHLGHMQVCTSLQADNHASTPPLKTTKHIYSKIILHFNYLPHQIFLLKNKEDKYENP